MSRTYCKSIWLSLAGGLLLESAAFGQTVNATQSDVSAGTPSASAQVYSLSVPSSLSALQQAFAQQNEALGQDVRSLIDQGATEGELEGWIGENSAAFQANRQMAQQMAAYAFLQPEEYVLDFTIPGNVPQETADFIVTQADLANSMAQIHNQLVQAQGNTFTLAQVQALGAEETDLFAQQNGAALAAQQQRAKDFAEQCLHQPEEVPPPVSIPAGASPALQAFLTLQNELTQEQVALHNQYCGGTDQQLQAATDQWEQQNSGRLQQLNELAAGLGEANINNPVQN